MVVRFAPIVMCCGLMLAAIGLCAQDRNVLRSCLDSCDEAEQAGAFLDALRFADRAMKEAERLGDSTMLASVLVRRSEVHRMNGDLNGSLTDLHDALSLYDAAANDTGRADVLNAIGSIHHYDGNFTRALGYYRRSLDLRKVRAVPEEMAVLYGNLGSALEQLGDLDSALYYHRANLAIRKGLGSPSWIAVCYANLGECFDKMGEGDSARHYLEASLALLDGKEDDYRRSHVLRLLGMVYLHEGALADAVRHCRRSLELATTLKNLLQKKDCYDCLYQAYRGQGRTTEALQALEALGRARDSLFVVERGKENIRIEMEYQFEREQLADSLAQVEAQHQAEVVYQQRLTAERDQKRLFLFGTVAVLMVAGGLWSRLRYMRRSRNIIQQERDRSDRLLLNILPKPIADELKATGRAQAREVEGVSLLFTDFHGFTRMSECFAAQELVAEIDRCFRAFDAISARHGLEKIKTIGDAYMAASGLLHADPHSAAKAIRAALEMQAWVRARAVELAEEDLPCFCMRVGIHTGPVIAGIVGDTKFQYDVWGDTVNTAAHMESSGAVGEVNISRATHAMVMHEPGFVFTPRGMVMAKGKGAMEMYFVGTHAIQNGSADRATHGEVA